MQEQLFSLMDIDATKPVLGGLQTIKAQTKGADQPAQPADQRLCYSLTEKYHI